MNRRGSIRTDPTLVRTLPAPAPAPRRRHCWVRGRHGNDWPGLLLEWRRSGGGWEARVIYIPEDALVVQAWVPAAQVRPRE